MTADTPAPAGFGGPGIAFGKGDTVLITGAFFIVAILAIIGWGYWCGRK